MLDTSIHSLLRQTGPKLQASTTAQLDAEILLAYTLKKPRSYLYTWPEKKLTQHQAKFYLNLVNQRIKGVPVAYLVGYQEFWNLKLKVTKDTLIPRPETELLVECSLKIGRFYSNKSLTIADLGTGSGAIALALANEQPYWYIIAIDSSVAALKIAYENINKTKLTNVSLAQGQWCTPLAYRSIDLIISNPPYIIESDLHLQQGDVRYEPKQALISKDNGLFDIKCIIEQATKVLKKGGWLFLEHGYQQSLTIQKLMHNYNFHKIKTRKDLSGWDRVTFAQI